MDSSFYYMYIKVLKFPVFLENGIILNEVFNFLSYFIY